jgi:hypothetical protein
MLPRHRPALRRCGQVTDILDLRHLWSRTLNGVGPLHREVDRAFCSPKPPGLHRCVHEGPDRRRFDASMICRESGSLFGGSGSRGQGEGE